MGILYPIALNLDILRLVKSITPLDNPEFFIPIFAREGCRVLSFQQEVVSHHQRELSRIREMGVRSGLALNPSTPLQVLDYLLTDIDVFLIMTVNPGFAGQKIIPATIRKVEQLQTILDKEGIQADIQVDGNVSFENIAQLISAGATMLVGGTSSIFMKGYSITEAVEKMRNILHQSK
jgi:ribulose-phosphate 3-epimerase